MRQVVLCYEIGFEERVHTLGVETVLGFRGSGLVSGSRVRRFGLGGGVIGYRGVILANPVSRTWFGVGGETGASGSVSFLLSARSCRVPWGVLAVARVL